MSVTAETETELDLEGIRAKYRQERDKRIRDDGINQYIEVKDEFASFVADPGIDVVPDRAPVSDDVDFLIVGGGFSGLLMGALLKKAGFDNIRILDNGGDFGGTWYWNRYPGVQCDIEFVHVPAASRRPQLHAEGEILLWRGDSRLRPSNWKALQAL